MHLHNIFMIKWFQNLCFYKNVVYVTYWADIFCFYDFNCIFLAGLNMLCEKYVSKSTLSQLFTDLILTKTTTWVKVFSFGSIQNSFMFNILKIIFEVLSPVRIKQSENIKSKCFLDIIKRKSLMCSF